MKQSKSWTWVGLLVAWSLAVATPAAAGEGHGHAYGHAYGKVKQELRSYFQERTDEKVFSGSVLVARDGKILLREGFGMADYVREIPNRPDTVFAIASMTKAFAAMSIMMLEEAGLLSIDDPVASVLPAFPNGDRITIRNLLNQTSGLFEYLNNPELWENSSQPHTPEELLPYFVDEPLGFEPGTQFEYSNPNYVTAGLIIETVSGMSFRDFVQEMILGPLGMDRTSYDPDEVDFPDRAVGYDDITLSPPVEAMYIHPSIAFSAGGMISTVEDLYRWDQALYTEALVSQETLERIFTPGLGNYGFGWYIDELEVGGEAHRQIWHWGAYFGFHSFISRLVDDRVTIILLLNLAPPLGTPDDLRPVVEDVAAIVFSQD